MEGIPSQWRELWPVGNLVLAAVLAGVAGFSLIPVLPPYPKWAVYAGLWVLCSLSLAGVQMRNTTAVNVLHGALCLIVAGACGFFLGGSVAQLFPAHSAEMYDFRGLELTLSLWLVFTLVIWLRLCDVLARRKGR